MHKFSRSWQNILKSKRSIIHIYITFLPSANEVWGMVIFSQAAIVLSTGGQLGLYPGWSPSRRICIGRVCMQRGWADPPKNRILRDAVDKQAVFNLLECILVSRCDVTVILWFIVIQGLTCCFAFRIAKCE